MRPSQTSLAHLASVLGLAPSTVSRALTGSNQVSMATQARVQHMAAELRYQPNQAAAALRRGHSRTLGVLVPHLAGSFFPAVVASITEAASQVGYTVMVSQSQDDEHQEKKNLNLLLQAQVAGLLVSLASTTHDFAHFETVREAALPLVFFDRAATDVTGPRISSVVLDDYEGAYQAVTHLITEGYRRIAHFAGPLHLAIHRHRHQGYLAALHDHGLSYDENLCYVSNLTQQAGATGMQHMRSLPIPPDAIFSSSDSATVGALQFAKERQLHIPQDVALAGFSNAYFSSLTEPALTTVDQDSEHMGRVAVRRLLHLLHAEPGSLPVPPIVLSPKLLIRASSCRVSV
ncbi:MAG: LacI family DNA-binding transcriptional regulator [Janthinobacterium lividum]